ncbi:unnamed protein product, partial [Ectocarpus sp. 6 AP-2014]
MACSVRAFVATPTPLRTHHRRQRNKPGGLRPSPSTDTKATTVLLQQYSDDATVSIGVLKSVSAKLYIYDINQEGIKTDEKGWSVWGSSTISSGDFLVGVRTLLVVPQSSR